ncbi:Ribosome biogenesis protein 1 [Homalodisca vitripennis]|nr:Ribosome biogenesis protein 1 [Homalodisca vitripennis]
MLEELVEWFSSDVMKMPLRKFPEHKRSFLPSKSEKAKVSKYVHALKMGWMKSSKPLPFVPTVEDLRGILDQLSTPFLMFCDFNAHHRSWASSHSNQRRIMFMRLLDELQAGVLNDGLQ